MRENKKNSGCRDSLLAVIDLIPDPVVAIDGTGKIIAANMAVETLSGYPMHQLIGKNFFQLSFLSDEIKVLLAKNAESRLAGSNVLPYEIKIRGKNGEIRHLEVKGNRIEYEGHLLDLAIFHDVTEDRNLHNQLVQKLDAEKEKSFETEFKIKSIFDSSPDAIAFCSMDGKVLECNQAMAEIFHFKSPAELVGKNGFTLVSPSDHQKRVDTVNRIAKNGLVRNVELNMQTCDGEEFIASFSGRRLDNSSGSSRGFVA